MFFHWHKNTQNFNAMNNNIIYFKYLLLDIVHHACNVIYNDAEEICSVLYATPTSLILEVCIRNNLYNLIKLNTRYITPAFNIIFIYFVRTSSSQQTAYNLFSRHYNIILS